MFRLPLVSISAPFNLRRYSAETQPGPYVVELRNSPTLAADFERTTHADKLHLVFKQSFPAVFISLANASLLLSILWQEISQQRLLAWYAAILAASLFRTVLFVGYRLRCPQGLAILHWEKPYFVTLVVSALVWGLGGLWLIASAHAENQLTIFFFLMGMGGGALSLYSALRPMALAAVASVLVPVTLWFLLHGGKTLFCTAIGSLLFLIASVRSTKVLSTALHQSFLLSHQLRHAKTEAERVARTDYLTGLHNRRAFRELSDTQVTHCERHQFPASLILFDLDDFKRINDTHGHGAGDAVLQGVASVLKNNTRLSDICGRLGGEEFGIFLPNTNAAEAIVVAEKVRQALEGHWVKSGEAHMCITASFGVSTGAYVLDDLLLLADGALYQAKEAGKNAVHLSH